MGQRVVDNGDGTYTIFHGETVRETIQRPDYENRVREREIDPKTVERPEPVVKEPREPKAKEK